jgi:signal transduction histidine kinase
MTRVAVQHVSIEVCDDGVGFDPAQMAAKSGGGFGMFSIRQRLEVFGGHLEIQSSPGQGTQVTIRAPLGKAAEEDSHE